MNKIITTSILALFAGFTMCAQSRITLTVIDASTGLPAVNQFAVYKIYPTNGTPPLHATKEGATDQNGTIFTQYSSNLTGNYTMVSMSYDCNGQYVQDTAFHNFTTVKNFNDTLTLPCFPVGGLMCNGAIDLKQDTTNVLTLKMSVDTTLLSGMPPGRSLFAGDWTFNQLSPSLLLDSLYADGHFDTSYTFPGPGTYSIRHVYTVWDTTLMVSRPCYVELVDTVTLPFTSFCRASYTVDTSSSNSSLLTLVNNSHPSSSFYTNTYSWDFGDGNTSTQQYPSHTYAASGAYQVCVTINSTDGFQNSCTNTFCDTVGIDSLGNVIYKSTSGFTLRVIDPNTVGTDEPPVTSEFSVYPNPAKELLKLQTLSYTAREGSYRIYDMFGQLLLSKTVYFNKNKEPVSIDVSSLSAGFYLIHTSIGKDSFLTQRFEVLKD